MDQVRLAVIGAGVIGRKHIETIGREASAVLVAIADPAPAAAALAGETGAACFSDFSAMLSEVKPDGVIVSTPTELHEAPAIASLEAGAHILVEKPIAVTVAEAGRIAAAAEAGGRHVLVGHHRRYYPLVHRTREIVRGGALGPLIGVAAQWTARKHDAYFDPDWRKLRAAGPVLTNMIHETDLLRYICGEIESVYAETGSSVRGHEKEETAAIIMRFASGALGTFLLSDATPSPWTWEFATGENPNFPRAQRNCYRFMGAEAALEFPDLAVWRHDESSGGWHDEIRREDLKMDLGDAFEIQCRHFCNVIRGAEEPRITARDATATLAATVAVFEAQETGRPVLL